MAEFDLEQKVKRFMYPYWYYRAYLGSLCIVWWIFVENSIFVCCNLHVREIKRIPFLVAER